MPGSARIKILPKAEEKATPFEELLKDSIFATEHAERLRNYPSHERLLRAQYHKKRYLQHLDENQLYFRIGDLIANATHVSNRTRYSTNNPFVHYWRKKLAQTTEELAIRNANATIPANALKHLPELGFLVPQELAINHDPNRLALIRYDKLKYLRKLQRRGEIYLRCASSMDIANDTARNDANELRLKLHLPADEVELNFISEEQIPGPVNFIGLNINQKTDFYMFCLSQAYDWRLFADFNNASSSLDPEDKMACLVITDATEFTRRFIEAAEKMFANETFVNDYPFQVLGRSAHYYDAFDPQECKLLFEEKDILPFAKRREYTYQHEFRFVIKPDLPEGFIPPYPPDQLPQFERRFLNLGSLEEISSLIEPTIQPENIKPHYLSDKNITFLASAIGVTLPNSGPLKRFVYSVEKKEVGRNDPTNLTNPKRFSNSSVQLHSQEIDVVSGDDASILQAVYDFLRIFDLREHGNHLIGYKILGSGLEGGPEWEYRTYLPCDELAYDMIESQPVRFKYECSLLNQDGQLFNDSEIITFDGYPYLTRNNSVGALCRRPAYRSLLEAEMIFIQRLLAKPPTTLISHECWEELSGLRVSNWCRVK